MAGARHPHDSPPDYSRRATGVFTAFTEAYRSTATCRIKCAARAGALAHGELRLPGRYRLFRGLLPLGAVDLAGDRAQLSQVLHNLIGNAMKYGRAGTPVTVKLWRDSAGMVRISVTDEGEGIAPEHIPRLTERFYRVDPGRSRAAGGTGLGLAIVKHIIERHRGRFDVASVVGKGTTVTILLPAHGQMGTVIKREPVAMVLRFYGPAGPRGESMNRKRAIIAFAASSAAALALSACQDQANGGGAGSRDHITVVGSSTVFPFTTIVAEQLINKTPGMKSPAIESTGTGGGMKLFCAGVGAARWRRPPADVPDEDGRVLSRNQQPRQRTTVRPHLSRD
eukprot:gene26721-29341_t